MERIHSIIQSPLKICFTNWFRNSLKCFAFHSNNPLDGLFPCPRGSDFFTPLCVTKACICRLFNNEKNRPGERSFHWWGGIIKIFAMLWAKSRQANAEVYLARSCKYVRGAGARIWGVFKSNRFVAGSRAIWLLIRDEMMQKRDDNFLNGESSGLNRVLHKKKRSERREFPRWSLHKVICLTRWTKEKRKLMELYRNLFLLMTAWKMKAKFCQRHPKALTLQKRNK